MTALRIQNFGGMLPRYSERLLPESGSALARNCRLDSGELRPIFTPVEIAKLPEGTKKAYPIPIADGSDVFHWMHWPEPAVEIIRGPLVNDAYDRYYWTQPGVPPRYNTRERILAGEGPYRLGVPAPTKKPTLTVEGGDAEDKETRAYVYTLVTEFGEEGPPSDPVVETGNPDGVWTLAGIQVTKPPGFENTPIDKVRIYRTVPGTVSSAFFFVAEIAFGTGTYDDKAPGSEVALNSTLESTTWFPPPADMQMIIAMPNGICVGFVGTDIHFSEPFRPHAWPVDYVLSTEFPVVGRQVFQNTLVLGTSSTPYTITGIRPDSMAMAKIATPEPCVSRYSVVSMDYGVLYASPNGLVLVNGPTTELFTRQILTSVEWQTYGPKDVYAVRHDNEYFGYYNIDRGYSVIPHEQNIAFIEIDLLQDVQRLDVHPHTGRAYVIQSDGKVFEYDPPGGALVEEYQWKSKRFVSPDPLNLGAYRVEFDQTLLPLRDSETVRIYNEDRIQYPLAELANLQVADSGPTYGQYDQHKKTHIGGSPLLEGDELVYSLEPELTVRVWADTKLVYEKIINKPGTHRLPSGFKATNWQFEFVGQASVYSFHVAETGRELKQS